MLATLQISPTESTTRGFAVVRLLRRGGAPLCQVDLPLEDLGLLPHLKPAAVDFLLLAGAVYALDKLVRRDSAPDAWTRTFALTLPVAAPSKWAAVGEDLNRCLSFLTGDLWSVKFSRRRIDPTQARRPRRRGTRQSESAVASSAVSLFSGGLDSLIGIIDWLESHPDESLTVVGHHDGQIAGPFADQRALLPLLKRAYPERVSAFLARVGHVGESVDEKEITLRSRSLVFIALGVCAASSLGAGVALLIPENGTIALNVPLTPSRRGSCSTRTAHPHFLATIARILQRLGLQNPILNPLTMATKGEAVTRCRNRRLLRTLFKHSVSCAKRGHRMHWTRRKASGCGRCMPCIYRRAALHSIGWDTEIYGDDVCAGEVELSEIGEKANDFRACLSFLKRKASAAHIGSLLMSSGSLDPVRLADYASVVARAMNEIRQLLRDKASSRIKRLAGV